MKLLEKAALPFRRRPSVQDFDFSNMDEYQYDVEGKTVQSQSVLELFLPLVTTKIEVGD